MWPPALPELKTELGIDESDTRDDATLQSALDAAVSFVERVRPQFRYDPDDTLDERPDPGPDHELGTIMLASRWHARRRSPEALVQLGELGAARIPSFDPDVERMLRIGRYALPVVG